MKAISAALVAFALFVAPCSGQGRDRALWPPQPLGGPVLADPYPISPLVFVPLPVPVQTVCWTVGNFSFCETK